MNITHLVLFNFWKGASEAAVVTIDDVCQDPEIIGRPLKQEIVGRPFKITITRTCES